MNRLIIICEGQAEQEFSTSLLYDYFLSKDIIVQAPTIKKSNGGIVKWNVLKNEIEIYLKNDKSAYVTTFIDYYGIGTNKGYPNNRNVSNTNERRSIIEGMLEGMLNDIDLQLRDRFIPYIQLHEFESLVFSDTNILLEFFENEDIVDIDYLNHTIKEYSDPELINNSEQTAPSKRILRIIPVYDKILDGKMILEEIGINELKSKCLGFNNWITRIEDVLIR